MKTEGEIRKRIAELSAWKATNAEAIKALRWVVEPDPPKDEDCFVSRKPKFKNDNLHINSDRK